MYDIGTHNNYRIECPNKFSPCWHWLPLGAWMAFSSVRGEMRYFNSKKLYQNYLEE